MHNNEKLDTEAVAKQKRPKYQAEQKPTKQIDSPKKKEKKKVVLKQTLQ